MYQCTVVKEFIENNQDLYHTIEKLCRYNPASSKSLNLTEEQKEEYAGAVISAAEMLIVQNPDTIFLPTRGGALHGEDIIDTAWMICRTKEHDYSPRILVIEASGIGTKDKVRKRVKEKLTRIKSHALDDDSSCLADFTIIDSAYTGMAYRKLLNVFAEVFPSSRINGIVLRDGIYKNDDIDLFAYTHERLNSGNFYSVKVKLPWEDVDLYYHDLGNEHFTHTVVFPRLDYYEAREDIMNTVSKKIGFDDSVIK